jgi:transglutaminase-like putative cysteine protease
VAAPLAGVAVLTAAAALGFTTVFAGGGGHVLPLLGAALVPCAVAGLLAAWRVPAWLRTPLGLAALAVYVTLAVAPGLAVVDGPRHLLTAALPLDPAGPELGAVALLVGLASLGGAELALRSAQPVVAALPALSCFVLALAVGASGSRPPWWLPALLVAGCGALLALAANRGMGRPSVGPVLAGAAGGSRATALRRLLPAAAMVAAAAALAGQVGPLLPGATARPQRFDARDLVAEPVVPRTSVSPLVRFARLRGGPARTLFVVRADRPVAELRLATLGSFDGRLWSSAGVFRRAGHRLPPGPPRQVRLDHVRATVEVADPGEAPWLPVPGRATELSVAGLGVDAGTGDLVVPDDRQVPARYQVGSVVPRLTPADLRGAAAAPGGEPSYQLPVELREAARRAAEPATTAFGQLANLATWFRSRGGFTYDDRATPRSGHGLFQVHELLDRYRSGTAEQYASAFAVMAGSLGYDTRVVMGFRRPAGSGGNVWKVSSHDVHAWPEVRFARLGWVAFDPSPQRRGAAAGQTPGPPPAADQDVQEAIRQELAEQQQAGGPPPDQPPAPRPRRHEARLPRLPLRLAAELLAALALAAVLLPPTAKALRRRRRRRSADPPARVVGAWREAVDRLSERGVPASRSMTSGEVADAGASRLGEARTEGLGPLARLVDQARFAPGLVDQRHAATAWQLSDRLRRRLDGGVPSRRRVLHAVDARTLLRRGSRLP